MASRYNTLLKDTLIFGLGNLDSKLILFLMVPLYTNYMTSAEYGTVGLVFTMAQLFNPFLSLVIFDAVSRFGLSKNEKRENVLLIGYVVLCFSIVAGLILVPVVGLYGAVSEWTWYLYLYIIVSITNSIEFRFLKAKGRNKSCAFISVVQTALSASLNFFFLVFLSMGVQGCLVAYIMSNLTIDVIIFIAGDYWQDLKKAYFDEDLFKRMVFYSAPLILNNISWWVIHSSDKVMIEAMISVAALGIFTAASKIPALINVMVAIFQQAWGISAVREIETTNDGRYYSSVFKYLFLFTSCACIVFVSIMKFFMRYYVGEAFRDAWHYVPLLLVSAVFASVASYYGTMYGALKKSVNNMLTTLLAAVVNIAVNWIFIPITGIWGAVIGTVVSYIVLSFARMFDVQRYLEITTNWKTYLPNCLIIIIQAILVSFDIHIVIVSVLALVLFVIINFTDIRILIWHIIGAIKGISGRLLKVN